jgi:AsmA protein
MQPSFKKLMWAALAFVGAIVLMMVIAIVLLTQTNPNVYKDRVTQTISQEMGLEVSIGNLGWSFFPWLGMKAEGIQLQNPELPANDPARQLLQVHKADIKVKVMPLFFGNLEVGTLRFDQPKIIYQVNQAGKSNWQSTKRKPAAPPVTESGNNTPPPIHMINIDALVIDKADIRYQENAEHWNLNPVNITVSDIQLKGQALLRPVQINVQAEVENKNIAPTKIAIELNTQLEMDISKNQLMLNKIRLDIDDAEITGQVTVKNFTAQPQIMANLNLAPLNVAGWLQKNLQLSLGMPADRLQLLSFNTEIKTDGKSLQIQPLLLQLDQTKIQGEVAISDLQKQSIKAKLQVDQINIDQYFPLPPPAAEGKTETTEKKAEASSDNAELFSVETVAALRQLDMQAELKVGQLRVHNIDMKDTQVKMSANNGLIKLSQLSSHLLQGSAQTTGELDVRGATPRITIKPIVDKVQMQSLLSAFEQKPMLSGELNMNGEASMQGNTVSQLKQGLMSQLAVNMDKGALKEINLFQKVQEALTSLTPLVTTLMPNQKIPQLPAALNRDTEFKKLLASVSIENGIVKMNSLNAGLEQAQLQGGANWSLVNDQGDLDLQVVLSDSLVSPKLAEVIWPVHCQISLVSAPKCGVALDPIRRQIEKSAVSAAKDSAADKLKEQESQVKQKAEEKINKALNKLFK